MSNQSTRFIFRKPWHYWETNKIMKKYRKKTQLTRKLRTVDIGGYAVNQRIAKTYVKHFEDDQKN